MDNHTPREADDRVVSGHETNDRVSLFSGMEWWNGLEWNSGMTTPTEWFVTTYTYYIPCEGPLFLINARRMRTSVTVVCLCYQSTDCI